MEIVHTDKSMRLFDIVVDELCCTWNTFLENVESQGWTSDMLKNEIDMCNNKEDFIRLANKFI